MVGWKYSSVTEHLESESAYIPSTELTDNAESDPIVDSHLAPAPDSEKIVN